MVSLETNHQREKTCMIFAWIAAAVLLSTGVIGAINSLYWLVKILRSRKWPTAQGRIIASEVSTETGDCRWRVRGPTGDHQGQPQDTLLLCGRRQRVQEHAG